MGKRALRCGLCKACLRPQLKASCSYLRRVREVLGLPARGDISEEQVEQACRLDPTLRDPPAPEQPSPAKQPRANKQPRAHKQARPAAGASPAAGADEAEDDGTDTSSAGGQGEGPLAKADTSRLAFTSYNAAHVSGQTPGAAAHLYASFQPAVKGS